jgi:hypothetical protein
MQHRCIGCASLAAVAHSRGIRMRIMTSYYMSYLFIKGPHCWCWLVADAGAWLDAAYVCHRQSKSSGVSSTHLGCHQLKTIWSWPVQARGWTPLMRATWTPSPLASRQSQKLTTSGVGVCSLQARGWTPLMWAASRDFAGLVEVLLGAGADLQATENAGPTVSLRGTTFSRLCGYVAASVRSVGKYW